MIAMHSENVLAPSRYKQQKGICNGNVMVWFNSSKFESKNSLKHSRQAKFPSSCL